MLPLQVLVDPPLAPDADHARQRALIEAVARRDRPAVLRVSTLAAPAIVLGRYHLAPTGAGAAALHRRLSGGRVAALGPGFAAVSLVLPHRSALVGDDPLALTPVQVLNRCVRGVLAGVRGLGIDAFYPGRDTLTVERRLLGVVGLECEAGGVTTFEAIVALEGDWSALAAMVETADPDGRLTVERLEADRVTALARHRRQPLELSELAYCLAGAYAREFGVVPEVASARLDASAGAAPPDYRAWIGERRWAPHLTRHGLRWAQLGVVEAHVARDGETIADVVLAGDFLADSPGIAAVETAMRGAPADPARLAGVVRAVFADPGHFLLGVEPMELIAETVAAAC